MVNPSDDRSQSTTCTKCGTVWWDGKWCPRCPRKVACMKCGASYWYDGCTWCPHCDANSYVGNRDVLPNAPKRILAMRMKNQEMLESEADASDPTPGG